MLKYSSTGLPANSDSETVPPLADFSENAGAVRPTAIGPCPELGGVS
jgi:hypothetical protein